MLPIETAATFFAASVLLALAPGPDNIFVLTQSALQGRAAGMLVTLGLCTGLVVHTSAVALGVAVIFRASSLAFTGLKLAGAAYLLYLAWQAFRAGAATVEGREGRRLAPPVLYRRGIIMNVTNPKVSIFFLAFLPQFADPERGELTLQIIALGGLFIVATFLIFGCIAVAAGWLGEWLRRSVRTQRVMNRVAGLVFLALAVKLATSSADVGYMPRTGDILFQTSRSTQSLAIQRATHSRYSHVGIVQRIDGESFVREAIEPVTLTPLDEWIARGEEGHFVAKRLVDADRLLTEAALSRLRVLGDSLDGRPYDWHFGWSDDRMYCSELVWKLFERAVGVEVGRLETMREMDLTDSLVSAKVAERWGGSPPLDEPIISPAAIHASEHLERIHEE